MTVTGQTKVNYSYDNASHLTKISQGTSTVQLNYDSVGRRSLLTLPNGVTVQYVYDADLHITGITYQQGSTTLGNLTYTYDALGRRSQVGGSLAQTNLPAAVSSTVYNTANQLTTWAGTSLTYDFNGNLKTDGTNTYSWDLRNQLSAISGGSTASFQYDGLRRRISKTINGTSTAFLYDRWDAVQELSGSTPTANLLTGLRPDEIFTRTDSAGTRVFLADALGSTLALTDTTGAVQTQYMYEPFGNASTSGATSTNAFQYTGRENDGTGLYFYRDRYYKPGFARFVSEDPIGFAAGDPNLYPYVGGDPINYNDPSGDRKWYGNWCGPDWTGGQPYPYDPNKGPYLPPVPGNQGLDQICKNHDMCYYNCRKDDPCDKSKRQQCMRDCDTTLLNDNSAGWGFMNHVIQGGIVANYLYGPDPGANGGPNGNQKCSKSNQ